MIFKITTEYIMISWTSWQNYKYLLKIRKLIWNEGHISKTPGLKICEKELTIKVYIAMQNII